MLIHYAELGGWMDAFQSRLKGCRVQKQVERVDRAVA